MTRERVYRWRIGAVAVGSLVALGLLFASPLLLAATVVPLSYVAYGSLSSAPTEAAVAVERRFGHSTPAPGEWVQVELTVTNTSDATLPDLRVVDGVPEELSVVSGSPRRALALRPGESATVAYDVVARRGEFAFADPLVRLRPLSGAETVTERVAAAGETELSAVNPVRETPDRHSTLLRAGTHPTDSGGEGLEFRSTRAYRPGDPKNRIHWRRFAKTGELTTVSYREERAVRTVLVVDARAVGHVTPEPGLPTATERCAYAAERVYEALVGADVVTSVTALGLDGDAEVPVGDGGLPWVDGEADDAVGTARLLFDAVRDAADEYDSATDWTGSPSGGRADPMSGGTAAGEGEGDGGAGDGAGGDGAGDGAGGDGAGDGDVGGETAGSPERPAADGGTEQVRRLLAGFPPTAQVVFFTPLLDDWPVEVARTLAQREYPVTVVSPDATDRASLGRTVAALERDGRLAALSAAGVSTVRWRQSESLDVALSNSLTSVLS